MRRRLVRSVLLASLAPVAVLAIGCGGGLPNEGTPGEGEDGGVVSGEADLAMAGPAEDLATPPPPPDLLPPPTRFMEQGYQIPSGSEFYQCLRMTVKQDTFIKTIIPVNGNGTHHEVFAIDPTPKADGISRCGPLETDWLVLFASGVGSPPLDMPPGVALKIPAGKQVVLDLHLFNATGSAIDSSAALDIVTMSAADVKDEAEAILAGNPLFTIKPGDNQVVKGSCSMTGNTHFFAVFPHMHQLGKHIRVWSNVGGQRTSVYDDAYQFADQDFKSFTPIPMKRGDRIEVECTYNNTTGMDVKFGDSSTEEMCFAISYRYPKLTSFLGSICAF